MNNFFNVRMLEFNSIGDERGKLVVCEGEGDIPFALKRVFYIYGSSNSVVRGNHANRKSEFVLINVSGSSKVKIKDGKGNEMIYLLNRPHTGIYIPAMVWKEMYDFSADSVLLCLSSEHYNQDDYIRDYGDYMRQQNEWDA
ncbi:FdtA/QdtA family cupin domain-containing protein [Candidatus Merdisoma sp. JLR.KK011]|uniref:sugar 3,4-ketoisomerase n=1 Tax=Candidatus Merdisoma sp. JLR.KK011 TaxID=3114299 RepID=UPI002FF2BEE1